MRVLAHRAAWAPGQENAWMRRILGDGWGVRGVVGSRGCSHVGLEGFVADGLAKGEGAPKQRSRPLTQRQLGFRRIASFKRCISTMYLAICEVREGVGSSSRTKNGFVFIAIGLHHREIH